jgi:hypothetical protein
MGCGKGFFTDPWIIDLWYRHIERDIDTGSEFNYCFVKSVINLLKGDFKIDVDRRKLKDRRKKPTPVLSRFTFFGRRQRLRRKSDQERGGYVDRYSTLLFFFMVLILGLNILDSLFTMMILDLGGREFNPFVRFIIELHGEKFWIWRFIIVSVSLILLCLNRRFKLVRWIIIGIGSVYLIIVLYQIFLIVYR